MTILFDSSWIEKGQITDQMLFLAKKVPEIRDLLMKEKLDPIQRSFLGLELIDPNITSNLEDDIRIAKSFVQNGGVLDTEFLKNLEQRAVSEPVLHVDVARIHVQLSPEREEEARRFVVREELPFVFPGELTPLHIELFAVGDRALHVLHVDGLKALAQIALDALEVDVIHQKMWFYPFLEVLPEKIFIRKIRKLSRKVKYKGGGIGLLAFYALKLGMDSAPLLRNGDALDQFFYDLAKQSERSAL
jgi:hypothetical protein